MAEAETEQFGGPGNAGLYTTVYLKRSDSLKDRFEVLEFSVGGLPSQSGSLNLIMKWETPTNLNVTYNGRAATVDFQAVKCAGISISTRDISGEPAENSH